MNGAGDQLLACTSLAKQQDCGIAGSDGLNQFQNVLQRRAVSDDILKVHLAADFFFEIELLLRELVFEFRNLVVCQCVFDGDCYLPRSLGEKFDVGREGRFGSPRNASRFRVLDPD